MQTRQMDLAYLTGQRPADALSMSEHDIAQGYNVVSFILCRYGTNEYRTADRIAGILPCRFTGQLHGSSTVPRADAIGHQ